MEVILGRVCINSKEKPMRTTDQANDSLTGRGDRPPETFNNGLFTYAHLDVIGGDIARYTEVTLLVDAGPFKAGDKFDQVLYPLLGDVVAFHKDDNDAEGTYVKVSLVAIQS